jgi:3-oxo-5alpha-steroid 4-dehydrogenase
VIGHADAIAWTDQTDLLVVGYGGAGVAAALEAAERGAKVLAVDRYEGGGSSTANGGVFYAGGGTAIQKAAGVLDTAAEMFNYLRLETQGIVTDGTLKHFCETSAETIDWLLHHGAKLSSSGVFPKKVSYPPLKYHLYHPDNSLLPSSVAHAIPAARGHRTNVENKGKAWGLGIGIWEPLALAAKAKGVRFDRHTEVRQLITDPSGQVLGVKALSIPPNSLAAARFMRYIRRANYLLELIPPVIPIAALTIALARRYLNAAARIEANQRVERFIRAQRGVLLSAGGFILNHIMVAHYAPLYARGLPNGTLGDTGSGIRLGESVGGKLGAMDRVTGWCNINPPAAWAKGIVVNQRGVRICHEGAYGSTLGDAVARSPGGTAFLIFDDALHAQALRELGPGNELVKYQRQVARLNLLFNHQKAPSISDLATKIGVDAQALEKTVADYNDAAIGAKTDPFGKMPSDIGALTRGPFHAIDVSVHSRYFPMPVLTLGGLQVDERTGHVLNTNGNPIAGLYAAGRSAVGICSGVYVSGLAYADCVYSGRRVARAVTKPE